MPRILHASDLHISESEKDYSLAVFSEIVEIANRERIDYLIFCGDLFNTFVDAEKLRGDFRRILGSPTFEFIFLPGNHEDLQRGQGELGRLDWGGATLLQARPFELIRRDRGGMPIEFLGIPHQDQYSGYANWSVPAKETKVRIVLAHGVVAGMSYRGPDEEGGGAALDPDMFTRFKADYAALGHIHGRRVQTSPGFTMAYPGSSRVWRRNEMGARGIYILEPLQGEGGVGGGARGGSSGPIPEPTFIALASAGEFRYLTLPLSLEGEIPDLDRLAGSWGLADYIELELTGLVEDERVVAQLADTLKLRYGTKVRKIEITRDHVSALPGIASQVVVQQFLAAWNKRKPQALRQSPEHLIWLRARELALNALKVHLEGRT
jgi:DNA repair exonuclease SbcCD nuclease subunit